MLRTLVFLIILTISAPGCHLWGWGKKSPPADGHVVDNFSRTENDDDEEEEATPTATFGNQNGRTADDPGTGLSNRSREIERNLGYR